MKNNLLTLGFLLSCGPLSGGCLLWLDGPHGRTNPHDPRSISYRLKQSGPVSIDPIPTPKPNCAFAKIVTSTAVAQVYNYGCWDGQNYWIGDAAAGCNIFELNSSGAILGSWPMGAGMKPLQLVSDGRYIWVGCFDQLGTLIQFDPVSKTILHSYKMNPSGLGNGGVQGVIWDGHNIWVGIAQSGGDAQSGLVEKIDPSNGAVLLTVPGQNNVNGMTFTYDGLQEYIWSADSGYVCKINATTGCYLRIQAGSAIYRVCTDGTYVYGADYGTSSVYKFLASTGQVVAIWPTLQDANDIKFDGVNVWTVGGPPNPLYPGYADIHDVTTGAVLNQITIGRGGSTPNGLVYDGQYMWLDDIYGNVYKAETCH